MSVCRGSIVQYTIRVNSDNVTVVTNVSADVRNRSVPFCSDCEVTVQAVNSQGSSPPATMTTRHTTGKALNTLSDLHLMVLKLELHFYHIHTYVCVCVCL